MTKVVPVEVYTTYLAVKCDADGFCKESGADLMKVMNLLRIPLFNAQGQYLDSIRFYRYMKDSYHFPVKILPELKEKLKAQGFEVETHEHPCNPERSIPAEMKEGWQDRKEHAEAFKHLLNAKGHMVGNDLQTGKGKSYVGVKLTTIWKVATLVVCDGLTDQWVDNYIEKTNIPADKIYVLQGIDSLRKLWDLIRSGGELPWVLVVSLKTLTRYSQYKDENYREFPRLNELMVELGIGYAIFDEVHLNTHAIVMLLLVLNINKNVFLSATPERSKAAEQKIFGLIFPEGLIGGSAEYDRYVDSTIRGYEIDLHMPAKKFESYGYGYSHVKYESILLQKDTAISEFIRILEKTIRLDYLNYRVPDTTKCLIFVSTVRLTEVLKNRLQDIYPLLDIRTYTSSDPIDNLHDAEIIISTPKSCGVGKDIKGLITVINTVSMSSKPGLKQMFGRLRRVHGHKCRFIDLINTSVVQQNRHFWSKYKVLKACSYNLDLDGIDLKEQRQRSFGNAGSASGGNGQARSNSLAFRYRQRRK